ncbi:lactate dehydrogenase/glycoside hydrolase [Aspergillus spinulosporus]
MNESLELQLSALAKSVLRLRTPSFSAPSQTNCFWWIFEQNGEMDKVRDLTDVAYANGSRTRVRAGGYREASQCDIAVITAGSKFSYGQPSLDYLYPNTAILRSIVNEMEPFRSDIILLIVANPVDLLTSLAKELSGLPSSQVLGSGTFLETVRLRGLLADKAGIAQNSIDLYVLGVHGDAKVAVWSSATIGGVPLEKALSSGVVAKESLARECRQRSRSIFSTKGAMPLGIGSIVTSICTSILQDKRDVRPISHFQPEFGCCFSLPAVLRRSGIIQELPAPMETKEHEALVESARTLKRTLDRVQEQY